MFCWKILILFGRDSYNILIFLQNFIQKYEFYIWVYFKIGSKSEGEKHLGDQKLKKFFRGTITKI